MWRRRLALVFISDIKFIVRMPLLFVAILSPLIVIVLALLVTRYISSLTGQEKAFQYYTVIAISLISIIPFIYGLVFSFMDLAGNGITMHEESVPSASQRRDIYFIRLVISGISAFVVVLPVIFLIDAVTTEAWLRSIYVSLLLATMAPFIYTLSKDAGGSIFRWRIRSLISVLFILPVPFGLILHHPWNYLAFFSPFYWINWAWIIPSPRESLIYGVISLIITATGLFLLYRNYIRDKIAK